MEGGPKFGRELSGEATVGLPSGIDYHGPHPALRLAQRPDLTGLLERVIESRQTYVGRHRAGFAACQGHIRMAVGDYHEDRLGDRRAALLRTAPQQFPGQGEAVRQRRRPAGGTVKRRQDPGVEHTLGLELAGPQLADGVKGGVARIRAHLHHPD